MKRKALAILLVLMLALSMLPVGVLATEEGDGTATGITLEYSLENSSEYTTYNSGDTISSPTEPDAYLTVYFNGTIASEAVRHRDR